MDFPSQACLAAVGLEVTSKKSVVGQAGMAQRSTAQGLGGQ